MIIDPHYNGPHAVGHGGASAGRFAELVEPGQAVERGDVIGLVGNTGRATGYHLHYEVRVNGIPQNPRKYLLEQ